MKETKKNTKKNGYDDSLKRLMGYVQEIKDFTVLMVHQPESIDEEMLVSKVRHFKEIERRFKRVKECHYQNEAAFKHFYGEIYPDFEKMLKGKKLLAQFDVAIRHYKSWGYERFPDFSLEDLDERNRK